MSELAVITIQADTYEVTEIPVGYAVIVIDESGEDGPVAVRYTDSGSDEGERVDLASSPRTKPLRSSSPSTPISIRPSPTPRPAWTSASTDDGPAATCRAPSPGPPESMAPDVADLGVRGRPYCRHAARRSDPARRRE
jgi:hypothetical protein